MIGIAGFLRGTDFDILNKNSLRLLPSIRFATQEPSRSGSGVYELFGFIAANVIHSAAP